MVEAAVFQLVKKSIKAEHATRKADKKLAKMKCGRCGGASDEGKKLQTCSRCKYAPVSDCSSGCQREHWKAGHKEDCHGFADPPFAKHFDPFNRAGVPWPVDPIIASKTNDGVGMWLTTHAAHDVSCVTQYLITRGLTPASLHQAFAPVDPRVLFPIDGPPSFKRWAGTDGPNPDFGPDRLKYISDTLMGVRVVVQNRRQDGRVVTIFPASTLLTVHGRLKDNLLPDDLQKVRQLPMREPDGTAVRFLVMNPWEDYNGLRRTAILELNGVEAPKATCTEAGEYVPASKPTGGPWDRVVDWNQSSVALGQGDYVVFSCQYRIGDGTQCTTYPDILSQTLSFAVLLTTIDLTSTDRNWCEHVRSATKAAVSTRTTESLPAFVDRAYLEEYYRPYLIGGVDAFVAARLGSRATQVNELHQVALPAMFRAIWQKMTPEQRVEAARRFDIGAAIQHWL
ncbi:hypothetical protein AURDEDRAFT_90011 [Auricularia subglabra TFB-10046 SS5]|nr:hypothetical protein AURDEDRAFT_90011 [Auricularia subglabra TFB-10046 SS5]